MAGFRTFATGEVLTAANVNDFLMKQSVMVFADAAARTAALGAEVAEGMLTYNEDTEQLEVFDGAAFVPAGAPGNSSVVEITASDATFEIPLAAQKPGVRVTVIGGGGGGGAANRNVNSSSSGGNGGTTTFTATGLDPVSATGGIGGSRAAPELTSPVSPGGFMSGNGGMGGNAQISTSVVSAGLSGFGGQVVISILDLSDIDFADVTIGAAGALGISTDDSRAKSGGPGGPGIVILEF